MIVAHPDAQPFNVYVAYDNDDPKTQITNESNQTLPTTGSNLLFIKQTDDKGGTWQPISPSGTAISSQAFSGNQDSLNLTNYIGVGNWKLNLPGNAQPGSYSGKIIWTMVDSDL